MYICKSMYTYPHIHMCTNVHTHIYIYIYIHIFIYICICIYIYIHTTYTYTYIYIHIHIYECNVYIYIYGRYLIVVSERQSLQPKKVRTCSRRAAKCFRSSGSWERYISALELGLCISAKEPYISISVQKSSTSVQKSLTSQQKISYLFEEPCISATNPPSPQKSPD